MYLVKSHSWSIDLCDFFFFFFSKGTQHLFYLIKFNTVYEVQSNSYIKLKRKRQNRSRIPRMKKVKVLEERDV